MGEKKVPLYIYVRRFVDGYEGRSGGYEYNLDLMESYIKLMRRIVSAEEEIGSGVVFLTKLPIPKNIKYYIENPLMLAIKDLFDIPYKAENFFKVNRVDIQKKLKNYLDFVRRGEG